MTKAEIQARIAVLRDELETRFKYGTIKLANADGSAVSVETLQNELYSLIYRLSKRD